MLTLIEIPCRSSVKYSGVLPCGRHYDVCHETYEQIFGLTLTKQTIFGWTDIAAMQWLAPEANIALSSHHGMQ